VSPPVRRNHRFRVAATSAAEPDVVFDLVADARRWHEWAGPMIARSSWDTSGGAPEGGVGAVRLLGRPPVMAREEIVASDPPRYLAYRQLSGLPVRSYRADVLLSERPDGGTDLTWSGTLVPAVPGTGPLLRWLLARTVRGFARRVTAAAAAAAAAGPGGATR
jgi:polyketide cyclase/dehydrase/lipid transport protein